MRLAIVGADAYNFDINILEPLVVSCKFSRFDGTTRSKVLGLKVYYNIFLAPEIG